MIKNIVNAIFKYKKGNNMMIIKTIEKESLQLNQNIKIIDNFFNKLDISKKTSTEDLNQIIDIYFSVMISNKLHLKIKDKNE